MPKVALSFDDGPGPSTMALLDVLSARAVKATFFLLGKNAEARRDAVVRMLREGHVVGNHTYSHARPEVLPPAALVNEVRKTDEILLALHREAGIEPRLPLPVRLPYGLAPDDPRLRALASLGRTHVHWTGDFEDWKDPPSGELTARMHAHIVSQHAQGLDAVIDLHDSSKVDADRSATVEAVRLLLEEVRLEFFTVPV